MANDPNNPAHKNQPDQDGQNMEQGDDKDQTNGGTQQTITQLQEENEDTDGKTRSEGPYGVEEPGHGER